jgi:uncharacterized protein
MWTQPYYINDVTCRKCFFLPACQGVSCPLPRVQTGDRPCPPHKVEIQQTLRDVRRIRALQQELRDSAASSPA